VRQPQSRQQPCIHSHCVLLCVLGLLISHAPTPWNSRVHTQLQHPQALLAAVVTTVRATRTVSCAPQRCSCCCCAHTYSRLMPSLDSGEPAGTLQTLVHDTRLAPRSDRSATSISVQPAAANNIVNALSPPCFSCLDSTNRNAVRGEKWLSSNSIGRARATCQILLHQGSAPSCLAQAPGLSKMRRAMRDAGAHLSRCCHRPGCTTSPQPARRHALP